MVTTLRAEEETLACDLNRAQCWYRAYSEEIVVWMGEQNPGWVKMFTVSGLFPWRALDSLPQPGGRAHHLSYYAGQVSEPAHFNGRRTCPRICLLSRPRHPPGNRCLLCSSA